MLCMSPLIWILAVGALSFDLLALHINQSSRNEAPRQQGSATAQALESWRSYRVGLFIHWGPSSGRALPQSHSHARKSALNPSGSVPAEV
jgi:hypothetical protein